MPVALTVSLPLVLAAVLIASGVAKLRHPDDLNGWRDLGVPRGLRRTWLLRLHPWGEIVLGVALAVLGGALGVLAGAVAIVLMGAYTFLIVSVLRRTPDASCSCFGEQAPVTGWTVVRNAWLTALAVATTATIWASPLWGGAVVAAMGSWWWVLGLAVAAVTVFLIMHRDAAETTAAAIPPGASAPAVRSDEELDYVRVRTPAVPVTLADGTVISLRKLAEQRPILLLAVSETCGTCEPVIESIDRYRELLPEVDVRFLLMREPDNSELTSTTEPQTLHDPHQYVAGSLLDVLRTPTAILVGVDGWLAGGPETGAEPIEAFVQDIYDSLHAEDPAR
ncbi:MauE/DoxX family redox-associated membrane protein [Microbacterium mangrovi]|uniref:MauE/DoxX family redox-associated membrane protein n=1 Tax=Microbacterium mangrovi TaxID=1348253 RepID=UPI00068EC55C|nr:MauE/DoxX family redox-associated membrane protein [Microbacterium mangrovi]